MYVSAGGTLADWLDAKRVWIEARRELAEARMAREIRCAELEALAGVDFEALQPATSVAAASQEVEP